MVPGEPPSPLKEWHERQDATGKDTLGDGRTVHFRKARLVSSALSLEPSRPTDDSLARGKGRSRLRNTLFELRLPKATGLKVTRDGAALQRQTRSDRLGTTWQADEEGVGSERACAQTGCTGAWGAHSCRLGPARAGHNQQPTPGRGHKGVNPLTA